MKRNQKGFTLMELMVVIVIVAILAAVAVPLYVNYVKDAQRTEAKGAIGAIITAEQAHYQRFSTYIDYTDTEFGNVGTPQAPAAPEDRLECDVKEAQRNWTFNVTGSSADGFVITAAGKTAATNNLQVVYTMSRANPPADPWNDTDAP